MYLWLFILGVEVAMSLARICITQACPITYGNEVLRSGIFLSS